MAILAALSLSAWYLAVVWFGVGVGLLPDRGAGYFIYGLIVAFWLMPLITVSALAIAVPLFATDGKARTARVLNGYVHGIIAASVMFPIHLVYGPVTEPGRLFAVDALGELGLITLVWFFALDVSRLALMKLSGLDVPPRFCAANLAFFIAVAGFLCVGLLAVTGWIVELGPLSPVPANAVARVMLVALLAGVAMTITFEIPRGFVLMKTRTAPPERGHSPYNRWTTDKPRWQLASGSAIKKWQRGKPERHNQNPSAVVRDE